MRTTTISAGAVALVAASLTLLPAGAAAAYPGRAPSPSPSTGSETIRTAGTSFLTATALGTDQKVQVTASTGDYLYWSFSASAGQTDQVAVSLTLPPAQSRHGASTWTVEVFDGLRRRQSCASGAQIRSVAATETTTTLDCVLREVRAWAEPWSGDPLPGTYYVRLSVVDLPEQDLGLPVGIDLTVTATGGGDGQPEGAKLNAPLAPGLSPGATVAPDASAPAVASGDDDDHWWKPTLPELSSRWVWTFTGGILAAVAGVVGFALTRPRRPSTTTTQR